MALNGNHISIKELCHVDTIAVFSRYGAPTYRMAGPEAASEFVVMVQHQSPKLRRKVSPKLKANVDAGQTDPDSYAMMLTDP